MRISLAPFDSAVAIVVPMPPIDTLIFCALQVRLGGRFNIHPEGYVPFMVFVAEDEFLCAPQDRAAWALDHRMEILAEARRLALTPVCFN